LMVADAFLWVLNRTPSLRRALWRVFFDLLASRFRNIGWWTLMNYGYAEAGSANRPFDLSRGPLVRGCLVRLEEAEHALLRASGLNRKNCPQRRLPPNDLIQGFFEQATV